MSNRQGSSGTVRGIATVVRSHDHDGLGALRLLLLAEPAVLERPRPDELLVQGTTDARIRELADELRVSVDLRTVLVEPDHGQAGLRVPSPARPAASR